MEFKIKKLKNNQSGVVLIMSLMILLVMVISVIALSRVIVGEVKMTRNSDNSIVAFYAAESGIEQALYYLKLGRQSTDFSDFLALESLSETFIDNERNYSFSSATTTGAYFETFDISTSSPATAQIILPDGTIPGGTAEPSLSTQYNIDWSIDNCSPTHSSDRLEVSVASLYKETTIKSDTKQFIYTCGCNSADECVPIVASNIDNDKLYYFTFKPLDDTVGYLKLTPLPNGYSGEANISVVGNYRQSSHTINVKVNTLSPASNIFSYVLFSDDELSKGF